MKKRFQFIAMALLLCMVLAAAACSSAADQQSVEAIKKAGKITLYTNAQFPPFEFLGSDNKPAGVDVDIAKAIAEELGVELEVKDVNFDTIIGSIQSGKGSMGIAGITVTDERKESVDFSIEYTTSRQYIIIPADAQVQKLEDMAGMRIGVQLGTTGDFIMSDEVNGYKDDNDQPVKGVIQDTGASVTQYPSALEAAMALKSGKLDAVVIDKLPAEIIVANQDGLKTLELKYADGSTTEESYAICVAKGNDSLLEVVNRVLQRLIADGKIDEFIIQHTGAASQ